MAMYSGKDFAFSFGGTQMKAHIQSFGSFDVENILEDSKAFGDFWAEVLPTGDKQASDIDIDGMYDDAAGGPNAVFGAAFAATTGPSSSATACIITWGSTKTSSFSAYVKKWGRTATRNQITRYKATLTVTGAVTEA
jgi:hypothetical protein